MIRSLLSSGCLARIGHTMLTGGMTLVLFLHDTDLYHPQNEWIHLKPLLFVMAVLCSVGLYFAVSLMDPGYVLSESEDKTFFDHETSALTPGTVRMRRCGYCMLKPMRARHCKSCNHCVRRYDHHCPWIENCVGEKNHRSFMLYLTVKLVVLLWAFHLAWSGFHYEVTWSDWLRINVFLLLAFILITICTAVVGLLLACHLYLISSNFTTWEFMSYNRISYLKQCDLNSNPFDRGIVWNLWNFFCTHGHVTWEWVYLGNTYNMDNTV
ncbi:palmitoyltransferase ZDHHC12 isoform X2 [Pyxicephalus adspersus]|uniref:palmitoyltransferase ZDHHC12 isoform X2 n=1 Tax=Pyxicephalus adspersus TaxID=30357 RepID=UPI003B5CB6D6